MVNLLKPGAGMNIDPTTINASVVEPYVKQTAAVGLVPFLMNIIPGTFVGAFAEGNILQVLFISVALRLRSGSAGRPGIGAGRYHRRRCEDDSSRLSPS